MYKETKPVYFVSCYQFNDTVVLDLISLVLFLLLPAHPGCPGKSPESRKMVVVVIVLC